MGFVVNFLKQAPNVLKSYLLLFIHKLMIVALTTYAIIVFILCLYLYLMISLSLLKIGIYCSFIEVECIYSNCISTVFIGNVFIHIY